MNNVDVILQSGLTAVATAADQVELEQVKARYLGKSGELTRLLKLLGALPVDERRAAGSTINVAKQAFGAVYQRRLEQLYASELNAQLTTEALDVTLPGRGSHGGGLHPVAMTLEYIAELFRTIGFEVADGPEIETDFYNFQVLNIPKNHPARAMADTFYVEGGDVLRTHTSPIQARFMMNNPPPIKIVAPGRVYRVDHDSTHSPMFHQMEGLWVEQNVSFADLKALLTDFLRCFFDNICNAII